MKAFPLFGTGLHGISEAMSSEDRLNCFYEVKQNDERTTVIVRGMPGNYRWLTLPTTPVQALRTVGNVLYAATVSRLYSITMAGVVTELGLINGINGVVLSDNYIQLFIATGVTGYVYNISTAVLTAVTDVHYPQDAKTVTFLSGRFIVEKPGTREFYESAALDGLNWTYLGTLPIYGTKEQYSDTLVAVENLNGILVLFGTSTMEFWQDAGLSPQPFQLISGTTQVIGLISTVSLATVGASLLFLGSTAQGSRAVYSLNGYTPKRVSTSEVEDIINTIAETNDISMMAAIAYSAHGHDFYQLTLNGVVTLTYDATIGLWGHRTSGTTWTYHHAERGAAFNNNVVFFGFQDGDLYIMDEFTYTDTYGPSVNQVTTKHIRNGGDEFAITELALIMDTGVVPQSASYNITMEVSKDGGRTYGSPRMRTVGLIGQYATPRVKWDRLGSSRDFVLRFTMTDPIPFTIVGSEIEMATAK